MGADALDPVGGPLDGLGVVVDGDEDDALDAAGLGELERSLALLLEQVHGNSASIAVVVQIEGQQDGLAGVAFFAMRDVGFEMDELFGVPDGENDAVELLDVGVDVGAVETHGVEHAPEFGGGALGVEERADLADMLGLEAFVDADGAHVVEEYAFDLRVFGYEFL